EMGGMFSVLKVRRGQKPGDYGNPGWFKHPQGTVAYEFTGELPGPERSTSGGASALPPKAAPKKDVEVQIRKPAGGHAGH
ncbi:MAG: copper oxidase, partial [Ramlibacter sp.]